MLQSYDTQRTNNITNHAVTCGINTELLKYRNMKQSVMSRLMMLSAIGLAMNPSSMLFDESKNYTTPNDIDVNSGRDILVHNKLTMHTFTVHGVKIQAPNLKAAKKIYNRTKSNK